MKFPWAVVGQKITPRTTEAWKVVWYADLENDSSAPDPAYGEVYTIRQAFARMGVLWLHLDEVPDLRAYEASDFKPVLPDTKDIVAEMERKMRDAVRSGMQAEVSPYLSHGLRHLVRDL